MFRSVTPLVAFFAIAIAGAVSSCAGCTKPPDKNHHGAGEGEGEGTAGEGEGEGSRVADPNNPNNANLDSDCDGLSDAEEFGTIYASGKQTDPNNPDSDGDGIPDGVELGRATSVDPACANFKGDLCPNTRTDPTNPDTDGDGLCDGSGTVSGVCVAGEDMNDDGCVGVNSETDPNNPDTDGDGVCDGANAVPPVCTAGPDTTPFPVVQDTDGDGLPDDVETSIGSDPNNPDTDGDGLCDGPNTVPGVCIAGEDLNADGVVERGESSPTEIDTDCDGLTDFEEVTIYHTDPDNADTDGDGILDGIEVGAPARAAEQNCPAFPGDADPTTTTNPLNPDTDGDGIPDGAEDANGNGKVDPGELNPNDPTDGANPTVHAACAVDSLVPVISRVVVEADIQVALPRKNGNAFSEVVTVRDPSNKPIGVAGHDIDNRVAYLAIHRTPAGTTAVQDEEAIHAVLNGIGTVTNALTQVFTTWDGFDGVRASYHMAGTVGAKTRANQIVSAILGNGAGALDTTTDTPATSGFLVTADYVRRSNLTTIVLIAITPAELAGTASEFLVKDLCDGSALAQAADTTGANCDRLPSAGAGELDVLWAVDNSASMASKQQGVAAAGAAFTQRIANAGIDFRTAAVTSGFYAPPASTGCTNASCAEVTGNQCRQWTTDLPTMTNWFTSSPTAAASWLGAGDNSNGFNCNQATEGIATGAEEILTVGGVGGAATFSPASLAPSAQQLRQNTNLLVIFVGDADDQGKIKSSTDTSAIGAVVDEYEAFYRALPVRSVQMGGIVCPEGQDCGENQFNEPRVLQQLVNRFGGITGSIIDLPSIPTAVNAILDQAIVGASPYVLSKNPITSTVKVAMDSGITVGACNTSDVPRSRQNGFDVDPVTKTVAFFGTCLPDPAHTGALIAISYRTWIDQSPFPDPPQPACSVCSSCTGVEQCDLTTCQCVCPAQLTCEAGFVWNDTLCGCVCDPSAVQCDARHNFDADLCACTCGSNCNGQCDPSTSQCNPSTCACNFIGGG
jgi:hypothetical protein